ncbi:MAG: hypothetical protein ABI740_10475 [Alphaproteobacteria bacterium]
MKGGPTPARRWIRNHIDELEVRLQYGRGRDSLEICGQFGIGATALKVRAREGQWSRAVSELNRRDLSRRVWIAGMGQLLRLQDDAPESVETLFAAGAWQTLPPAARVWTPLDSSAHHSPGTPVMTRHQREKQASSAIQTIPIAPTVSASPRISTG